jgi:hypothetical protein
VEELDVSAMATLFTKLIVVCIKETAFPSGNSLS